VNIPANATYEWYFGDGNSITSGPANVTNIYKMPGTYTVLAKVDSGGRAIASVSKAITLTGTAGAPVASFTSTLLNPTTLANNYAFNSTSTISAGSIKTFSWDFGDANVDNSNNTYVTHAYNQLATAQNYTVTLKVANSAGCANSKSQTITVAAGTPVVPVISGGFSDTSTSPCSPSSEQFTFTGTTTNVPAGAVYNWNFGDNTTGTGNPVTKVYASGNTYLVKMTIGTYSGTTFTQLYSYQNNVTAYGQNVTPTASMTVTPVGSLGNSFTFQSTSTVTNGTIATNYWDFGDGSTTQLSSIQKTYTQDVVPRTYTVKLVSTSNAGCSAFVFQTVTIPAKI
jgi:PKD repeat protein